MVLVSLRNKEGLAVDTTFVQHCDASALSTWCIPATTRVMLRMLYDNINRLGTPKNVNLLGLLQLLLEGERWSSGIESGCGSEEEI